MKQVQARRSNQPRPTLGDANTQATLNELIGMNSLTDIH